MSESKVSLKEEFTEELGFVEQTRIKAIKARGRVRKFVALFVIVNLAIAVVIYLLVDIPLFTFIFLGMALMGCFGIYSSCYEKYLGDFQHAYKHLIIKRLTSKVAPSIVYRPERGVSKELFRKAGFDFRSVDRYDSEDLFEGRIGDTEIIFSEVHAEHERSSMQVDAHRTSKWETIFKGVFFEADFHKHFKSWLTIRSDYEASNVLGWINGKVQELNKDLIKLENLEFEKYFKVYGWNEVMARYILTPDMQKRIIELRKLLGTGMMISFRESSIYITVPKKGDWFEPDIDTPSESEGQMIAIAQEMKLYFDIVEILNLNTRIWTKH